MGETVKLTIDGKEVHAEKGVLLIEAARQAGIEIPAFCYYEGYSLQAACRMCLVEIEKMPKLQAACTIPVGEGMVVRTETDHHVDEKQWSPVVFYDGPRCILCYRCVRVCNEGMGVGALGIINRGVLSEIAPSHGDHLECDECGMCIDICPVGALTSGTYRYQTRPWEMKHVGTICTHCSNGCKTTLGVRNGEIIRGNNRDRSGINGEFLCVKGRYGFDFHDHPDRLQTPLLRVGGKLEPVSWSQALEIVAGKFSAIKKAEGKFGVIGSN